MTLYPRQARKSAAAASVEGFLLVRELAVALVCEVRSLALEREPDPDLKGDRCLSIGEFLN
jgi:hypothetical protein